MTRTTIRAMGLAVLIACPLWAQTPAQGQAQSVEPQAQQVQPQATPDETAQPPVEEAPLPSHRPGFLDALGRLFGHSREAIDSQVKTTQDAIGAIGSRATDAARDAAGSVAAMPGTRIVSGRQLCPPAPNGAPDCQQGVAALCRAKGFQSGRSIDISSSQRCPTKVWISGRAPKEGECRLETYVVRAICQ